MKHIYGLIGYPLTHSFSKEYFSNKFRKEEIKDSVYENFEIRDVSELPGLLASQPAIKGLNVTIPHKEGVIKYLGNIDPDAKRVGAVNVLKIMPDGKLKGYNSDYYGFRTSLERWLGTDLVNCKAMILGTGGAAKAVIAVLEDCNIETIRVSRSAGAERYTYFDIRKSAEMLKSCRLVINTTPLGMYPKINEMPNLPFEALTEEHYLYDLIYNPEKTLFLQKGESMGCRIKNGREMLELQAEKSWQIWNNRE